MSDQKPLKRLIHLINSGRYLMFTYLNKYLKGTIRKTVEEKFNLHISLRADFQSFSISCFNRWSTSCPVGTEFFSLLLIQPAVSIFSEFSLKCSSQENMGLGRNHRHCKYLHLQWHSVVFCFWTQPAELLKSWGWGQEWKQGILHPNRSTESWSNNALCILSI